MALENDPSKPLSRVPQFPTQKMISNRGKSRLFLQRKDSRPHDALAQIFTEKTIHFNFKNVDPDVTHGSLGKKLNSATNRLIGSESSLWHFFDCFHFGAKRSTRNKK